MEGFLLHWDKGRINIERKLHTVCIYLIKLNEIVKAVIKFLIMLQE